MPFRFIARALVALLLLTGIANEASSQDVIPSRTSAPQMWVHIQDSTFVCRISDTTDHDTIGGDLFSANWWFVTDEDSCRTIYEFNECRRNGTRLRLDGWADRQVIVDRPVEYLSDISHTDPFPLIAGDTLTFYRELSWVNRITGSWDSANFRSPDTLCYAVELVCPIDGKRLALLDTIGVLPQIPSGVPRIHGMRPFMAYVKYKVPPSLAGQTAFIRVRAYDGGPGEFYTGRYDSFIIGALLKFSNPMYRSILEAYGGAIYGRRALPELDRGTTRSGAMLAVTPNPSSGAATIAFSAGAADGPTTIAVYNAAGEPVFYPLTSPAGQSTGSVVYSFPTSGGYWVALIRGGKIIATERVTVTR